MRLPYRSVVALLLFSACGPTSAGSAGDRATEGTREANEAPPRTPPSAEVIASLIEDLEDGDPPGTFHGIDSVRETCPAPPPEPSDEEDDPAMADWYEACELRVSAAYDDASHRWIVLDIDYSEGGPEHFSLVRASTVDEQVILHDDCGPAGVTALRAETARFASLATPANAMTGRRVYRDYSLNTYAPLVELSAPLAGWLLYLETGEDLDHPEYALYLIGASGSPVHELGRRPARAGPIDGDGYYCMEPEEHECDEAGLRAEGRLAIEPLGIKQVAIGPDRTILIQGMRNVAGHGGYPPFHWVAQLPDGI